MPDVRAKCWCFTSYNVDDVPFNAVSDKYEYLCFGRETCPTTNRPHLQGYVAFRVRTKFSTVRNWLPGAHIEKARGSPQENVDYCKKDGDFQSFGQLPSAPGSSNKFRDAICLAKSNRLAEVEEVHPGLFLRYKKTLESCIAFTTDELDCECGVWICGPPGTGKDYSVRQLGDVFVKPLNKWWDGYRNQKYVLLSDVDPDQCKWLAYFLKIWADRYPFTCETKGGSITIRPKKIFVTSNWEMTSCFDNKMLEALQRRFTVFSGFDSSEVEVRQRKQAPPSDRFLSCLREHEVPLPVDPLVALEISPAQDVFALQRNSPPPPSPTSSEEFASPKAKRKATIVEIDSE